ncbi:MAG TPA: hypothetical protein VNH18_04680 [Bryobacteraceae bacterium]|nr:hypothetical protein [Bryobacteraceae bacterium]
MDRRAIRSAALAIVVLVFAQAGYTQENRDVPVTEQATRPVEKPKLSPSALMKGLSVLSSRKGPWSAAGAIPIAVTTAQEVSKRRRSANTPKPANQ